MRATFSLALDPATIDDASTFTLTGPGGAVVGATSSYDAATKHGDPDAAAARAGAVDDLHRDADHRRSARTGRRRSARR